MSEYIDRLITINYSSGPKTKEHVISCPSCPDTSLLDDLFDATDCVILVSKLCSYLSITEVDNAFLTHFILKCYCVINSDRNEGVLYPKIRMTYNTLALQIPEIINQQL